MQVQQIKEKVDFQIKQEIGCRMPIITNSWSRLKTRSVLARLDLGDSSFRLVILTVYAGNFCELSKTGAMPPANVNRELEV